jgi:hypothetical protein
VCSYHFHSCSHDVHEIVVGDFARVRQEVVGSRDVKQGYTANDIHCSKNGHDCSGR